MPTGTMTCSPDPPVGGATVTVTLTGGTPGAHTVTFSGMNSDGAVSPYDMPVVLNENGNGTVQFGVPANWVTMNVSCPGFEDLNRTVG